MKEKKNNIHTVLLTGANGGLGLKLADKISEHCKKLLLFGRNKKSLLKLKKKLEAKHTYQNRSLHMYQQQFFLPQYYP